MKKGFTIAEMIGVVIILCVIAVIAFPPILNLIKNTEKDLDDANKELVITAATQYVTMHNNDFAKKVNSKYYIYMDELLKEQLLSNNIIENSSLENNSCVKVSVDSNLNYAYDIQIECLKTYSNGDIVTLNVGGDTTSRWYIIDSYGNNLY